MGSSTYGHVDEVEIYRNRLQQVTNLNAVLFQTPPIISTIVGGIWYFAAQHLNDHPLFAMGGFLFAALAGYTGRALIRRTAQGLHVRLVDMSRLEGGWQTTPKLKGRDTADIMVLLMSGAIALSTCGAIAAALPVIWPAILQFATKMW